MQSGLFEAIDITPDIIDVGIKPYQMDEVDLDNLKFQWEATKVDFDQGFIEFQVNFTSAIWISSGE